MRNHLQTVGRGRPAAALSLALALLGGLVLATEVQSGTGPVARQCFGKQPTVFANPVRNTQGTSGDDVIAGTPADDRINGRGGKDLICGGKGSDTLNGGGRDDKLNGQGDADTLRGGAGDDKHTGGPNGDTIEANTGKPEDRDLAKGSDGDDDIDIADGMPNDTADGGSGENRCTSDPGDQVNRCTNID